MQTPKDLRKMAPFLLVTAVPFAQYVTLPLAFWFPKQLLSKHYWSIEQRTRFAIQDHTSKLYHYRPIFRYLQKKLDSYPNEVQCRQAFAKLGSGTHPTVPQVLELSPLFTNEPFGLDSLSHTHLVCQFDIVNHIFRYLVVFPQFNMCKIHGVSILPGKKIRLKEHIYFVKGIIYVFIDCNSK